MNWNREWSVQKPDDGYGENNQILLVAICGSWDPTDHLLPDERDVVSENPLVLPNRAFVSKSEATISGLRQGPEGILRGSVLVFLGLDRKNPGDWAHYLPDDAMTAWKYVE